MGPRAGLPGHLGGLRSYGPGVASGGVRLPCFHPEVPGLIIAPFLLYVSDEGVLGGKRAHGCKLLFRGFIVFFSA